MVAVEVEAGRMSGVEVEGVLVRFIEEGGWIARGAG